MGFFDFLGGPSKTDLLYEELVELRKLKSAHGKEESQKLMDKFYYLATIFLAFGRKEKFLECLANLHLINPSEWVLENTKLATLLPLNDEKMSGAFYDLKQALTPILSDEGKISVTGQASVYPDNKRDDLTKAVEAPHAKYKKHTEKLTKKIQETFKKYEITLPKENATKLAQYLLNSPIETHRALSQTGTITRTNKLFELTQWHYELLEKLKKFKKDFYQDKSANVNTKNYAQSMLSVSYYFLVTGLFDVFIETLKGVEEGSKKYKENTGYPENPEWVREYYALATEQTRNVYEWMLYYL